jgi:DNA-directed RNA polymerase specialized sigma24 family protein
MTPTPADTNSFLNFLDRVRAGDQRAAEELVHMYEPEIRREVRLRLRDPRLRRDFDSVDICQSVLASFFVRASLGQYELQKPEELIRLLVTMTRNKLVGQVRKQQTQKRDLGRRDSAGQEKLQTFASGPTPSLQVANDELIQEFRKRMSPEELQIAERRKQGQNWETIAAELGGTGESCRKQLSRAVDRVSLELGLDLAESSKENRVAGSED